MDRKMNIRRNLLSLILASVGYPAAQSRLRPAICGLGKLDLNTFFPVFKPAGAKINNNNVNRRFAGSKLNTLVAAGDDETK